MGTICDMYWVLCVVFTEYHLYYVPGTICTLLDTIMLYSGYHMYSLLGIICAMYWVSSVFSNWYRLYYILSTICTLMGII